MSIFKTRAVVLKVQDFKENDKIIWLFSEKLGKISCIVRGAKTKRSKFASFTQQFCYGEYVLFKGKSFYTVNEIELIDSFQSFLNNFDSITYGSYFCELIIIALQEQESNRILFEEFIKTFYLLKSDALDVETIARTFEVKLLKYTGFEINFNRCAICNTKIESSNSFSTQFYGGICNNCKDISAIPLSKAAFNYLRFFNNMPMENIHRIKLSYEVKEEINSILNLLICQSFSRRPKSLDIFNYLNKEHSCYEVK